MFFPVRKLFWALIAIVIVLLTIYSFNALSILLLPEPLPAIFIFLFDINAEGNIPTWYSTALLLCISLTAFRIQRLQHQRSAADLAQRVFWYILMAVFLYLSLDEAAQLHALIDQLDHTKWIFFYAPLALAFFVYSVYHWRQQPRGDSAPFAWIVGGITLYLIGAGVMEWVSYSFMLSETAQYVEYILEEGMEMLGAIGVLTGCMLQANRLYAKVTDW